jgi:two-component system, sensor histidine kinase ChiS
MAKEACIESEPPVSRVMTRRPVFLSTILLSLILTAVVADAAAMPPIPACALRDESGFRSKSHCSSAHLPGEVALNPRGLLTEDALAKTFDERMEHDDFAGAERVLACAAEQIDAESDWRAHYALVRRYGVFEYKRNNIAIALERFECALQIAKEHDERPAIAKQLKNIGSSLRRIGSYENALDALLRSLEIQRALGDPAVGPVLNNIADVYRKLGRSDYAERYYRQALDVFRESGAPIEPMHVYVSLSELAFARGDVNAATGLLKDALHDLQTRAGEGGLRYQLSVYAGLAHIAIAGGDVQRARDYCADGLALAAEHALPIPLDLQLETARADRLGGRLQPAMVRLRSALAEQQEGSAMRAALSHELAAVLKESGRQSEAFEVQARATELEMQELREQSGQRLAWLQERFNAAERERENASLREQSRRRMLLLWLTILSAVAALSIMSIVFVRRQQRTRLAAAVRQARDEAMLARYRDQADALGQDRDLLQALLDSRSDALCLLDADGRVLAANRAACGLIDTRRDLLLEHPLATVLSDADAQALMAALEGMEDASSQTCQFADMAQALQVELTPWDGGDGLVVLTLHAAPVEAASVDDAVGQRLHAPADEPGDQEADAATASTQGEDDPRAEFRRTLVELMLALVDTWERTTGSNRLELAEKSRIWRVNIDDGRLRARAMERYLSVSKLPQNPRWRDVLRSAYFVLAQCTMEPAARDDLQRRVDAVLAYTRRDALV